MLFSEFIIYVIFPPIWAEYHNSNMFTFVINYFRSVVQLQKEDYVDRLLCHERFVYLVVNNLSINAAGQKYYHSPPHGCLSPIQKYITPYIAL